MSVAVSSAMIVSSPVGVANAVSVASTAAWIVGKSASAVAVCAASSLGKGVGAPSVAHAEIVASTAMPISV